MPILVRNAEVYAPRSLGQQELLISGDRIAAVADHVDISGAAVEVLDAAGMVLVPGLVDALTHPCGGGGEGGYGNRTGEISAADFAQAGVTCPVGALGTDALCRSLEVLFGCVMGLRAHGVAAHMFTGSYQVPPVTLTGSVDRDIALLDPVIGVGEIAISDHRSSQPTPAELRRLAAQARTGGIISGKRGVVFVHVGDGEGGLDPLRLALEGSDLPSDTFYPTHCNRTSRLFNDALAFAKAGASIDFTASTTPEFIAAGEVPALEAFRRALDEGVPADRLTLSSDAGGSLPLYEDGELKALQAASPTSLTEVLQEVIVTGDGFESAAVAALTLNPANALGLNSKGRIEAGADADLLLLSADTGALRFVMCAGRWLVYDGQLRLLQ